MRKVKQPTPGLLLSLAISAYNNDNVQPDSNNNNNDNNSNRKQRGTNPEGMK